MTAALQLSGLTVAYTEQPVLAAVDLEVPADEVVALLGPSGSGKSTLLHAVAGFIQPRAGEVSLAGHVVSGPGWSSPPESRDVGVVFQHYALWPHLTAVETVAYPLRRRGVGRRAARQRAGELLDRLGLQDFAARRPAQLSGGQQQRVGLARALAREPSLFLFDEPTAHLDTALRAALQEELAEQRRAHGAAALYATHDAGEALAVADRVVLLRDGRVAQVGSPAEVYQQPADLWAARLTGPAGLLAVRPDGVSGDTVALTLGGVRVGVPGGCAPGVTGVDAAVLVRPEWAQLGGELAGTVCRVAYRGPHTDYRLDTAAGAVAVRHSGLPAARPGDRVTWSLRRVWLVDAPEAVTDGPSRRR